MSSNLLVVGTVAYDSVKTPAGQRDNILGGSASYCAMAASYFTGAAIVAVVGEDFRGEDRSLLLSHAIDLSALETVPGAKSFHWKGEYGEDLNEARTLSTDLNVLSGFDPRVPDDLKGVPYLFLANIDPAAQLKVLDQVRAPKLVAADTMNYWINNSRDLLMKVLPRIDVLIINEAEAKQLTGERNGVKAAGRILALGPSTVIVKRGEYGALLVSNDDIFAAPAFPLLYVVDPTGAGDSFAGGFMGLIAKENGHTKETLRRAVIAGSCMASFNVQAFSLTRLADVTPEAIKRRYKAFHELTDFEGDPEP